MMNVTEIPGRRTGKVGVVPFRDTIHAALWLLRVKWDGYPVTVRIMADKVWEIPAGVSASDLIRTPWVYGL